MSLFDGKPLSSDEIPTRCDCGHIFAFHMPDGDECSECECEYFSEERP